jgi:hypothetical protein
MNANSSHRIWFFGGLGLVAVSVAVFAALAWRSPRVGPLGTVTLGDAPYAAAIGEPAPRGNDAWSPPPAQSRGREWVYDAFTPPQIFFNARSKQFTVKPPAGLGDDEPEEAFGLELVAVRPEPFRLQLIGYVGDDGNWRGTFQNVVTGEVVLAPAGRRLPTMGLFVKSLDVQTQTVATPESMPTRQRVAVAVVHDEKSGRDITLTHRERKFTDTISALVAAPGETAAREVRVGDTLKLGAATYRIDKAQLAPPTIEVTKEAPTLAQPDRRTLSPREAEGDASSPGTS